MPTVSTALAPRPAVEADFEPLADLFTQRWTEAHADFVPEKLRALRTRDDFLRRLRGFGDALRVVGPKGDPQGFCALKGNHIDQLYVSRSLAGTGAALVLIRDGEARIAAAGHSEALLECNPGNARAAAFYRKSGWTERGREVVELDSAAGPFPLEVIVFARRLAPSPASS